MKTKINKKLTWTKNVKMVTYKTKNMDKFIFKPIFNRR